MGTVMKHSEELRRAVQWVLDEKRARPDAKLTALVNEAGPRFNLSPAEMDSLQRILAEDEQESPTRGRGR